MQRLSLLLAAFAAATQSIGCNAGTPAARRGPASVGQEFSHPAKSKSVSAEPRDTRPELAHEADEPVPLPSADTVPVEKEFPYTEAFPESHSEQVGRWCGAHGVTAAPREKRCWDAGDRVGLPNAPGLFCEEISTNPPTKKSRLYRLEGRRLKLVWEATVATYANWVELTPALSQDGGTLTLVDATRGACERALCESHAKLESSVQPRRLAKIIVDACSARGLYEWTNSKYVLSQTPPVVKVTCEREVDL